MILISATIVQAAEKKAVYDFKADGIYIDEITTDELEEIYQIYGSGLL